MPQSAMDLPVACGAAVPGAHAMPNMPPSQEMQASMAKMSDAQKAYMQAMAKMHPSMMTGVMSQDPDVAFACMMIPHHQGAIEMARILLKHGKDPATRAMAETVIRAQEKEIAELKAWLAKRSASIAPAPSRAGATALATVSGEVLKIDQPGGKITLKHGPIKNLDMDSMTMVFRVAEPAMLEKVKPGDKVSFEADRVNGAITVTKIEKAK